MSHLTRGNLHLSDQNSQIASLVPKPIKFDEDWVLISGFVLIFTQVGFALIESGSVRYKNSQSIAIKVILGLFLTLIIWWIVIIMMNKLSSAMDSHSDTIEVLNSWGAAN